MNEHDPIVRMCKEPDLFAPDVDPWADLEQAESDLADRDVRITALEAEIVRLRTACESALFTIAALESGKLTDFAAHYTMVVSACAKLRAVLKQKGDGDG